MADLTDLQAAGATKIVGSDATGLETNPLAIDSSGNVQTVLNNAAGSSAVNIQDGGNSITVDGTVVATQSGTWTVATDPIFDRVGSGSLTALNTTVEANTQGMSSIILNVTGTWVGTISSEGLDNGTWLSIVATDSSQSVFSSQSENNRFVIACGNRSKIRLRMSAYTSGTANVEWNAGVGTGAPINVWNTNATSLKVAPRSDNINSTGSAGSLNADLVASIDVGGYQTLEINISGTWVGTVSFQASDDNSTFNSILATNISLPLQAPVTSTTTNGTFYIPLVARYLRIRMTSYTSGTANGAHTFDTLPSGDISARYVQLTDGVEVAAISPNLESQVSDILNNGGTQAALTVGTSAVEVMVGGSPLSNRKSVTLCNNTVLTTIYWGYTNAVTTSTGTPIVPGQLIEWTVGPNTHIFVIAGGAGNNTRITEAA